MKNYTASEQYYRKALEINVDMQDSAGIAQCHSNLSVLYEKQKNYPAALENIFLAFNIQNSLGDKRGIAISLGNTGAIYLDMARDNPSQNKQANLDNAITYLLKGIAATKELHFFDGVVQFSERLSEAYSLARNDKKALEAFKEFVIYQDSIFSNDSKLKIARLETEREADLKEKQIEINNIQDANKRRERWLYILSTGLLSVVIVSIGRNYNKQKRTSAGLQAAYKQVADEKLKLEVSNTQLAAEKVKSDKLMKNLEESITEKDKLAVQLSLAADMKSRFLANISHELRTPVTLLTGMLELMKDKTEQKTSDNKDKLSVAYNNSRRLQYMVEEILDLSKLETSQAKAKLESKEIVPVLRRMVYAFETLIEKENLSLAFTERNAGNIHVAFDENLLEKIVNNLVYNAIKFNVPGGWIKTDVSVTEDGKYFIFTVNNSGRTINAQDLPHIFERYYQAGPSTAKAEGMGIGLSLVKEFTELMGGTVAVTSTEAAGTTFTLQFPVAEGKAAEKDADDETLPLPAEDWGNLPGRQTVLIVEDNVEMRYYLREVLGEKVNIAEAGNGKEALKWLERNQPDLIVSDIMMPEMDGREFIAQLKKSEAYRKIPVITLSALADKENQVGMLRMGIDDYIVKPFNAAELRIRVYNLLKNYAERRTFNEQPFEPDDVAPDSTEAETFREKITAYVLVRMKTINVSVYDLAYELNMSERQLYRMAKSLTGCTPAQLIKEVRLQKAYELLVGGTIYKVDDVSKQVGFEDPNYFSRQFCERFGKRPAEFL